VVGAVLALAALAGARRTGVTYRLAVDPAGRAFDAFGGLGMPTTVLVRADGTVADILAGQLSDAHTDSPWDQLGRAVAGPLTSSRLSHPPGSDRGEPWD
jgi:hypothetical protein